MEPIIFLIAAGGLVTFEMAAWHWGADSRDGLLSPEWDQRRRWRGFGNRAGELPAASPSTQAEC